MCQCKACPFASLNASCFANWVDAFYMCVLFANVYISMGFLGSQFSLRSCSSLVFCVFLRRNVCISILTLLFSCYCLLVYCSDGHTENRQTVLPVRSVNDRAPPCPHSRIAGLCRRAFQADTTQPFLFSHYAYEFRFVSKKRLSGRRDRRDEGKRGGGGRKTIDTKLINVSK